MSLSSEDRQRLATKVQIDVLKAIDNYVLLNNFYPNIYDIGNLTGRDIGSLRNHILALVDKGYVERSNHGKFHQLKVVKDYDDAILARSPKVQALLDGLSGDNLEKRKEEIRQVIYDNTPEREPSSKSK